MRRSVFGNIIIAFVIVSFSAAVLAGCGGPDPGGASAQQETSAASSAEEESTVTEAPADETEEPEATPESAAEETASESVSAVSGTSESTETEEPSPAEPAEEQPDNSEMIALCSEYMARLRSENYPISSYKWQKADGVYHYPEGSEPAALLPVAVADVYGDEKPELIYMRGDNEYSASLHICAFDNGEVRDICAFDDWDLNVAAGTDYGLFLTSDEKTLYAYSFIGDERGTYHWYRFDQVGDLLVANDAAKAEVDWTGQYTDQDTYMVEGMESDAGGYAAFAADLADRAVTTVIFSGITEYEGDYGDEYLMKLFGLPSMAMSYNEARMFLYAQMETLGADGSKDEETALFEKLDGMSLTFSSGAGAWGTVLTIGPGGTCTISYHDSNMGESGEGYDATVYYSNATGRFTNVKRVNDTTYTMDLTDYVLEVTPGEEYIEEVEGGTRVRHSATELYGMSGPRECTLYLPGTPISDLPEDAFFRMFCETDHLYGTVIYGDNDFYTDLLPGERDIWADMQ